MNTRRERRSQEVKSRMMNAGIELLADNDLQEFSVEDICEKADVAKKTFYNYFSNKEALFADLIQDQVFEVNADIFDRAEERCEFFSSRIHYVIDNTIEYRKDYGEVERKYFRAGIKEIVNNSERMLGFYGFFDQYFERWVLEGQASGELTKAFEANVLARMCSASFIDVNQNWMNDPAYPHLKRYKELGVFLVAMFASWDKELEYYPRWNMASRFLPMIEDPEKVVFQKNIINKRDRLMGL